MNKLLYIGANTDIEPFSLNFSNFVFIDSLPRNEYGYPHYYKPMYHPTFKQNVIKKLSEKGLTQSSQPIVFTDDFSEINVADLDSHCVEFTSPQKHLQYFFSTSIPHENYSVFTQKIIPCIKSLPNALFVRGHHPHEESLEMLQKPFHFIGCYPTYFPKDVSEVVDEEKNWTRWTCMRYVISNTDKNGSQPIIHKYTYIDQHKNLHDFSNYNDFYNKYKELQLYKNEGEEGENF